MALSGGKPIASGDFGSRIGNFYQLGAAHDRNQLFLQNLSK
jgi:hypothetical protein